MSPVADPLHPQGEANLSHLIPDVITREFVAGLLHEIAAKDELLEEKNRIIESLQNEIEIDSKTGLLSSAGLKKALERLFPEGSEGQSLNLVAVAIDLDKFKAVNDTHGHKEGDRVISFVGQALADIQNELAAHGLMSIDFHAARPGGDEYVLVFVDRRSQFSNHKDKRVQPLDQFVKSSIVKYLSSIYDGYGLTIDDDKEVVFGVSSGVASGKASSIEEAEHLIHLADKDAFRMKSGHKACQQLYLENEMFRNFLDTFFGAEIIDDVLLVDRQLDIYSFENVEHFGEVIDLITDTESRILNYLFDSIYQSNQRNNQRPIVDLGS